MKMTTWRHCVASTFLIVVCSLMQLALVMCDAEIDITSNFATATTTNHVDNQYSLSTLHLRKLSDERWTKLGTEKLPASDNRDDNQWPNHSSGSIIHEGLHSTINTTDERKYSNEKWNSGKMNESEILEVSVIDNDTNSSTTMPLSRKKLGDYNNELKIVQYDHQGIAKDSGLRQQMLAVKRRRQLSSPITSEQKIIEDYSYIEVKDPPDLRITPISLPDMDYENSEGEEFYEEMDELLKLKRMLNNKDTTKSNEQKQRGDMNPMISSLTTAINLGEKMPIRGDIVTRNKRSYRNDELWGFAEDEGYVSSDEVKANTISKTSKDYSANQLPQREQETQSARLMIEREKKLSDYIARNRPIVVPNRSQYNNRRNQRPPYSSRHDQLPDNKYNSRNDNVMEQRQSAVSIRNYSDLKKLREEERLNNIPVSARIIITRDPSSSSSSTTTLPPFFSRGNFDNDIDFPEISPDRRGLKAANFPAPRTQSPLKTSPDTCVWAIVQCCPNNANNRRLTECFEYMGCPGVNWDPNPCRREIVEAARAEVINYYASATRQ